MYGGFGLWVQVAAKNSIGIVIVFLCTRLTAAGCSLHLSLVRDRILTQATTSNIRSYIVEKVWVIWDQTLCLSNLNTMVKKYILNNPTINLEVIPI